MKLSLILLLQVFSASSTPFLNQAASTFSSKKKIAVVGGGVAGLTAAYYLKKEGYDVKVFESNDEVGGKVCTYYHQGIPYEMGAVWLGEDYKIVKSLAKEFNVPYHKVSEPGIIKNGQEYSYPRYALTQYNPARLILSWMAFKNFMKKYQLEKPGFSHLPTELHICTEELIKRHGMWAACDLTSSFMTGCGYGYFASVPGLYLMKLLPMAVNGLVQEKTGGSDFLVASFTPGWQQLWKEIARSLDVKLSCPVVNLRRFREDSQTSIEIETADERECFDAVIIAAPLQATPQFMDLDEDEIELFNKITTYRYLVTLVEGKNLPHASLMDHTNEDTIGKVNLIAQYNKPNNIYTVYQLLPKDMSLDEAKDLMITDIKKHGGELHAIIHQREWDYFPHVKKEELDAGYYNKIESLQGNKNTYYAGGIMNFETVETTASYSKSLVERYFCDKNP